MQAQRWSLRWLTPTTEVNLCGHATLATAHVIYAHKHSVVDRLEFLTRSGSLFVEKHNQTQYAMHFPAYEVLYAAEFTEWLSDGALPQYVHNIAKACGFARYLLASFPTRRRSLGRSQSNPCTSHHSRVSSSLSSILLPASAHSNAFRRLQEYHAQGATPVADA